MTAWSIVFAIGAAQAILLTLALWRRPVNAGSNRVLSAWIGLIGVDLAVKALHFQGADAGLFKLYRLMQLFPFFYGSLFYVYVQTLTQGRGFERRDTVHLIPFALAVLANLDIFLMDRAQIQALLDRLAAGAPWPQSPRLDIALFAAGVGYVVAALVHVRRYRIGLLARRSDADRMSLRWIDVMAGWQIVIWCIALIQWQLRIPGVDYPLIYGAVAAWVFAVGYLSLAQPMVVVETPAVDVAAPTAGAQEMVDDVRFPTVEARLAQLMEADRLYREPALTIGQLARRSGYPEYLVSAVINRRFEGNFWSWINRHRIEAARACLADPHDTRTVLDIAYDCGFTSKSTFNAAFKREVGDTPSAYRQRHAAMPSLRDADR
ncbi:AraC family transcriptional regulator [Lysobacter sp. LF1]|uniref:AraC family transcriptional regulator n=1 Tax=Lysobacter stagni TaxID=3045172 RepID=A0ABT6XC83_9GAMM|nr:AraC family transcriptional regulator [Lysobacter sp. LF1]MDI9237750.1 AraC family transcriptional regulator [Lysobacter sp. LF1]